MSEVVKILGNNLAEILDKPSKASRGLIRLAFKDAGLKEDLDKNKVSLEKTLEVLNGSLKKRLETIKVEEPEEIVGELSNIINKYQSIFTMSK